MPREKRTKQDDRRANLLSLVAPDDREDLERLRYLIRTPSAARWIFRILEERGCSTAVFRELVDASRAIELDFQRAMQSDVRSKRH